MKIKGLKNTNELTYNDLKAIMEPKQKEIKYFTNKIYALKTKVSKFEFKIERTKFGTSKP